MKNISPIISEAADAAIAAYHNAKNNVGLSKLRETHRMGKDGTPTKLLDEFCLLYTSDAGRRRG